MKFFVTLYVVYDNETKDKVGIYSCADETEVMQNFYKYMSQYVGADNVASVLVEARNSVGGIYKTDVWTKLIEEVEED